MAQIVFDFVLYNPNYKSMIYNYVMFKIDGSGYVEPIL